MYKQNQEKVYYQISNKGNLFIAFYETLKDKLSEEELSMELWNKFFNRFEELGGKI